MLRQDVGFGRIGAEADHNGNVLNAPPFPQHQDAYDGVYRAIFVVHFPNGLPGDAIARTSHKNAVPYFVLHLSSKQSYSAAKRGDVESPVLARKFNTIANNCTRHRFSLDGLRISGLQVESEDGGSSAAKGRQFQEIPA